MALTLNSQPTARTSAIQAAYYPARYSLTSDAYPRNATGFSIDNISEDFGYLVVETDLVNGFGRGDNVVFEVSGGSSDYDGLIGRVVDVISTTTFVTNIPYLGTIGTGVLNVFQYNNNFYVRSKVVIDGVTIAEVDVPPDPNGDFNFDVQEYAQRALESKLIELNDYTPVNPTDMLVSIQVDFGEVYDTPFAGVPRSEFQGYSESSNTSAYVNATVQYNELPGVTDKLQDYYINTPFAGLKKYLTNRPFGEYIYPGESKLMYIMYGTFTPPLIPGGTGLLAVTESIQPDGSVLDRYEQGYPNNPLSYLAIGAVAHNPDNVAYDRSTRHIRVAAEFADNIFASQDNTDPWGGVSGAVSLGANGEIIYTADGGGGFPYLTNPTLTVGQRYKVAILHDSGQVRVVTSPDGSPLSATQEIAVLTSAGAYEFYFTAEHQYFGLFSNDDNISFEVTGVYLFEIQVFAEHYFTLRQRCQNQEYNLFWLNPRGGMDSYLFTGRASRDVSVERLGKFKRSLYPDKYEAPNRQYGNITNRGRKQLVLNSEPLPTSQLDWLEELFISPDVYLVQGTDFYPVEIQGTSKRIRTDENGRQSISFEIALANDIITQSL